MVQCIYTTHSLDNLLQFDFYTCLSPKQKQSDAAFLHVQEGFFSGLFSDVILAYFTLLLEILFFFLVLGELENCNLWV